MQRIAIPPRNNWRSTVEQLGFGFHTTNVPYWDESAYYSFSTDEILLIEEATTQLWELCLQAVQYTIDHRLYDLFHIPRSFVPCLEESWREDHPSIYGRMDLCYRDGKVKMLEFNADTPTSLFEAGIVQWFWLKDFHPAKDQFNSIHEKLIEHWTGLQPYLYPGTLHFACLKDTLEDLTNVEYLRDCAIQAGIPTHFLFVEDIGWDEKQQVFVDDQQIAIKNLFKLYPWEWLMADEFGEHIGRDKNQAFFIEPAWKMILSNKAILPLLWELFPGHPHLLPAYFSSEPLTNYVKKPILSREGANIAIMVGKDLVGRTDGDYGEEGYICQEFFPLPAFGDNYPLIGSWVIGQQPAGIGIREAGTLITDNLSRFLPHLIE
ncbi:MAG TPA: glutathionylspermidine synthase family protein [Puia sp.]|jgi:glutathionylspermidine synthase|nr:glutathionylspermidine synthase family protein [Puia sp.]